MNIAKQLRLVLGPAIEAARAALRDLDDEDVPGRLRAIAKQGDGTLPVPLVKTLLRRIDEDDWFRGKVIESFDRLGSEDATSSAYLNRGAGWWIVVAESVTTQAAAEGADRVQQLQGRLEEARARSRLERAKTKALKRQVADAEKDAQAAIADRLDPLKAAVVEARSDCDRAELRVVGLRADVEEAREERRDAERVAAAYSEQVRSTKREVAELRRSLEAGASESIPRRPIEIARWLDRAAGTLTPFREPGTTAPSIEAHGESDTPTIPAGIAPDSAASIDALAGLDGVSVLIDGHNLLGVLDASTMASGRARRELIASLGKLDRHLGDATIEIVFDSDLADGRPITLTESGVVVRFAEAEVIADDVLVDLAVDYGSAAVVISDDREVRDRSARHGATVLWAKALAAWLES
jgi:predicted RNA-binding protein with PIN domain